MMSPPPSEDPAATPPTSLDQVSMPALLRGARRTYGSAIRQALEAAGYDDVPANGLFVIGAVARTGAPLAEIIQHLGVSKQSAGQLVDTLVARGYLDRAVDPDDRRRLTITLTARGSAAAEVIGATSAAVDAELEARVGATSVAAARATLAALIDLDAPHA
jgi:DNA-binding MarR family transcriptional regulator